MATRTLSIVISGDPGGAQKAFTATAKGADGLFASITRLDRQLQKIGSAENLSFGQKFGQSLDAVAVSAGQIGKKLTTNITLPLLAVGSAAGKLASGFETSFARIEGLAGVAHDQIAGLEQQVLKLAPAVGVGPKALGDGLYFLTSAGLTTVQAMDTLTAASKAAAASGAQVATISDAAASAVNAYGKSGLTGAKAVDIITAAVKFGKVEFEGFAQAIGQVIPIASSAGVSFAEVAAAMATLSLTGADAGVAATQVRSVIDAIIKPSQQAAKQLDAVGLSTKGLQDSLRKDGLLATLRLLRDRFKDNDEGLAQWVGRVEGFNAILSITGNEADKVNKIFDGTRNSVGAADAAFDVISKTAGFKMKQAFAQLQVDAIKVGDVLLPVAQKAAGAVSGIAAAFGDLDPAVQSSLVVLGGIVAGVGPALLAFSKITQGVRAFQLAMTTSLGPIGLVVAAIGVVAAVAFVKHQQAVADAKEAQRSLHDALLASGDAATVSADANLKLAASLTAVQKGSEGAAPGGNDTEKFVIDTLKQKKGLEGIAGAGLHVSNVLGAVSTGTKDFGRIVDAQSVGIYQFDRLTRGASEATLGLVRQLYAAEAAGTITQAQRDNAIKGLDALAAAHRDEAHATQRSAEAELASLQVKGRLSTASLEEWKASTLLTNGKVDYLTILDKVTTAVTYNEAAIDKLTGRTKAQIEAGDLAVVASQAMDGEFAVQQLSVEDLGKALDVLTKNTDAYLQSIFGTLNAQAAQASAFEALDVSVLNNLIARKGLEEQIKNDMKTGDQLEFALDRAKLAHLGVAGSLDVATESGRKNLKAIEGVSKATIDLIDSKRRDGAAERELVGIRDQAIDRLEQAARAAGLNREQTDLLTVALRNIPTDIVVGVTVNANTAAARAELLDFQRSLENLARNARSTGIGFETIGTQAAGGVTTKAGLSLIGERGPELLHLPTGATVIPLTDARVRQVAEAQQVAYQSPAADSGTTIVVNVQGSVLSERDLVDVVQRAARRGVRGLN